VTDLRPISTRRVTIRSCIPHASSTTRALATRHVVNSRSVTSDLLSEIDDAANLFHFTRFGVYAPDGHDGNLSHRREPRRLTTAIEGVHADRVPRRSCCRGLTSTMGCCGSRSTSPDDKSHRWQRRLAARADGPTNTTVGVRGGQTAGADPGVLLYRRTGESAHRAVAFTKAGSTNDTPYKHQLLRSVGGYFRPRITSLAAQDGLVRSADGPVFNGSVGTLSLPRRGDPVQPFLVPRARFQAGRRP